MEDRYYIDPTVIDRVIDRETDSIVLRVPLINMLNRLDRIDKASNHRDQGGPVDLSNAKKCKDGDFEGMKINHPQSEGFNVSPRERGSYVICDGYGNYISGDDIKSILDHPDECSEKYPKLKGKAISLENYVRRCAMKELSETSLVGDRLKEAVDLLVDQAMGIDYERQD